MYTLQVAVEDCTGCQLCVEVCPAKNKRQVGRKAINMEPKLPILEQEQANWDHFVQAADLSPAHEQGFRSLLKRQPIPEISDEPPGPRIERLIEEMERDPPSTGSAESDSQ